MRPNSDVQMETFAKEIEQGASSARDGIELLERKGLASGQKVELLQYYLMRLRARRPSGYGSDFVRRLNGFLLIAGEPFRAVRSVPHLAHIIQSLYFGRRSVERALRLKPRGRHIRCALMRGELSYTFGRKAVVGVALSVTASALYDLLEKVHLQGAVRAIDPGLSLVEGSLFVYQKRDDPVRSIYFEVQREDRKPPSRRQLVRLRQRLAGEIKGRIERLEHPIFSARNQEELFRNMVTLSRELHHVADLPQAMLFYDGQSESEVTFYGVVAYVGRTLEKVDPGVRWKVDEELKAGCLESGEEKVAIAFTLSFEREPYLRRDRSLDLYRARQRAAQILEQAVGHFRDYNGGLIVKTREVLDEARDLLGGSADDLLETLLYGLEPAAIQTYITPQLLAQLYRMVQDLQTQELSQPSAVSRIQNDQIIALRAEEGSFREPIRRAVDAVGIDPLQLASVDLKLPGSEILAYVLVSGDQKALSEAISEAIGQWQRTLKTRQMLTINLPRAARSLDPRIGADRHSGILMKMLFEGLLRLDEKSVPRPAIAHKIEHAGRRYRFHLRKSQWSNGDPLTAHDFAYAWRKQLDPALRSRHATFLKVIKGAEAAMEGDIGLDEVAIQVHDDHLLEVELDKEVPNFLELVAHWTFLPLNRSLDQYRPAWAEDVKGYVSNGPFQLAAVTANGEIQLLRNPFYWDRTSVNLDRVKILAVEEPRVALELYNRGKLDMIGEPLCQLPPEVTAGPNLISQSATAHSRIEFNTTKSPFHLRKMRLAFAHALDRSECEEPIKRLTYSLVGSAQAPEFDPEKARALFEEAKGEVSGTIGPFTLSYPAGKSHARHIAAQWHSILGVDIVLQEIQRMRFVEHILSGHFDLVCSTWYSWCDDPYITLNNYRKRSTAFNATGWENASYSLLLDQADRAKGEGRLQLLDQAETILLSEAAVIPLCRHHYHYLRKGHITDLVVHPTGLVDLKQARIQEEIE